MMPAPPARPGSRPGPTRSRPGHPHAVDSRRPTCLYAIRYSTLCGVYGTFLRQVRESRAMSQSDLAEVVGISQPNLSAYERDRRTPGLDVFNRILVACGYQVAADGGGTVLHMALPRGAGWTVPDDLPPRHPDDPPDEPPALSPDAPLEERALAVVEAVELAEAIMAWSGR